MKNKTWLISVFLLLALLAGCATTDTKPPRALAEDYIVKAQQFEKQGDLVEALKQYKLVLTVDPENKFAQEKCAALEPQLNALAEEHYQRGLKHYNQGQYPLARREFLTALRYNPEHAEAKDKLTAAREEIENVKRYVVHTLQPDETISTLADRYYGDYRKFHLIAAYNELEDPTKVTVGQDIRIPVIEGMPIIADPAAIQTEEGAPSEALPEEIITVKRYVLHTVAPEESLSKLAMMYYGDYSKFDVIAKFNNIEDGASVRVGQELKIPEVEGLPFRTAGKVEETPTVASPGAQPPAEMQDEKQEEAVIGEKPLTREDQAKNYRELGIELYENSEYTGAIAEFHKALNVNPADQGAREYMALAYLEKGRQSFENKAYAEAEKEFETALIYNQSCPDCRDYLAEIKEKNRANLERDAVALYNEKKYEQAIAKFEAIAKDDPGNKQLREYLEKSHFQQGLILFGKEDYLASRDAFKKALQYNENCEQCKKNIQKSEDMYKEVHYDKGLAYFGDQKLAEAIQEWEAVLAIDPNYKDVNKNLTKARTLYERLESIRRSKTQENTQ